MGQPGTVWELRLSMVDGVAGRDGGADGGLPTADSDCKAVIGGAAPNAEGGNGCEPRTCCWRDGWTMDEACIGGVAGWVRGGMPDGSFESRRNALLMRLPGIEDAQRLRVDSESDGGEGERPPDKSWEVRDDGAAESKEEGGAVARPALRGPEAGKFGIRPGACG